MYAPYIPACTGKDSSIMITVGGKNYYSTDEAASMAGVSTRTLRRWLSAGRLSDFLFAFRAGPNEMLYRLEPPEEGEEKNAKGEYIVRKGAVEREGVSSS